jgi:hypothetical protein
MGRAVRRALSAIPVAPGTESVEDAYGNTTSALSAAFEPSVGGPLWLVGAFPRTGAIGVAHRGDEPIVGAFLTSDPDERIGWAEQLTGD